MSETEWLLSQAEALAANAEDYETRAKFVALSDFIRAQAQRLELAEGEVDGRTWDHSRW
ncbi:hypothetical protein [Lacticaseibacillus mingshuiensis]|uniref:Uncharacterized protein n=1 Tax=Lacticaseibacillus mingshuiensis TaxID=2799574 RepID=A0ABW4CL49_9LACO|nr:hypothetical protein [Lacticaseibacillus mingshuiensis]